MNTWAGTLSFALTGFFAACSPASALHPDPTDSGVLDGGGAAALDSGSGTMSGVDAGEEPDAGHRIRDRDGGLLDRDGGGPAGDGGVMGAVPPGLTFQLSNDLMITHFGGSDTLVQLIGSTSGQAQTGKGLLGTFASMSATSTFPWTGAVYLGRGIHDTTNGTWAYDPNASGTIRAIPGIPIDAAGAISIRSSSLTLSLGQLPIALSTVSITGVVMSSGAIATIANFTIDGCLPDAALQAALANVSSQAATLVRRLAVADCDSDGDGTIDGYRVTVVSQPVVVQLSP
jgi:hypothetical protein